LSKLHEDLQRAMRVFHCELTWTGRKGGGRAITVRGCKPGYGYTPAANDETEFGPRATTVAALRKQVEEMEPTILFGEDIETDEDRERLRTYRQLVAKYEHEIGVARTSCAQNRRLRVIDASAPIPVQNDENFVETVLIPSRLKARFENRVKRECEDILEEIVTGVHTGIFRGKKLVTRDELHRRIANFSRGDNLNVTKGDTVRLESTDGRLVLTLTIDKDQYGSARISAIDGGSGPRIIADDDSPFAILYEYAEDYKRARAASMKRARAEGNPGEATLSCTEAAHALAVLNGITGPGSKRARTGGSPGEAKLTCARARLVPRGMAAADADVGRTTSTYKTAPPPGVPIPPSVEAAMVASIKEYMRSPDQLGDGQLRTGELAVATHCGETIAFYRADDTRCTGRPEFTLPLSFASGDSIDDLVPTTRIVYKVVEIGVTNVGVQVYNDHGCLGRDFKDRTYNVRVGTVSSLRHEQVAFILRHLAAGGHGRLRCFRARRDRTKIHLVVDDGGMKITGEVRPHHVLIGRSDAFQEDGTTKYEIVAHVELTGDGRVSWSDTMNRFTVTASDVDGMGSVSL
tara:strand:- start:783 stop:2510 length:1728 start_codon:yes stop_codon:yes gene_type:complete